MIRFFTKTESFTIEDIKGGGAFLVDKDLEWTSFDVVNKLRYQLRDLLGVKKIKVGHAGTLDPLATGLLIICFGKATKTINELQGLSKEYTGTFHLGATTPTYDSESDIDQTYPIDHIDESLLEIIRQQFVGDLQQVPPKFSALKKNGVPMYKLARAGKEVKVDPRDIHISSFEIDSFVPPILPFTVSCSKGTYIRSLAYDFGIALNSGAYLKSLRRTKVGEYNVSDAMKVNEVVDKISAIKS